MKSWPVLSSFETFRFRDEGDLGEKEEYLELTRKYEDNEEENKKVKTKRKKIFKENEEEKEDGEEEVRKIKKRKKRREPEDQWSCKRSPDIWAYYKYKTKFCQI